MSAHCKSRRFLPLFLIASGLTALLGPAAGLQGADLKRSFGERLGWKPEDVVVILHVDDVGMSHASNLGAIEAVEKGVASSWAVMMPCPWVPEIARHLQEHPGVDSGLHLAMTSEWNLYRWLPVAGKAQVPGMVDEQGCLWRSVAQVVQHATADEIEREIRAQLDRAQVLGLPITHLDSHMGTLFARPDFFERYARVAIEKRIPMLAIGGHATHAREENGEATRELEDWIPKIWNAGLPVLDDLHTGSYGWPASNKVERLVQLLSDLKPGVTEILFHASRPTEEFPLITGSSASRFADLQALTSPQVRSVLKKRNIQVTTWKELMARRQGAAPME